MVDYGFCYFVWWLFHFIYVVCEGGILICGLEDKRLN